MVSLLGLSQSLIQVVQLPITKKGYFSRCPTFRHLFGWCCIYILCYIILYHIILYYIISYYIILYYIIILYILLYYMWSILLYIYILYVHIYTLCNHDQACLCVATSLRNGICATKNHREKTKHGRSLGGVNV